MLLETQQSMPIPTQLIRSARKTLCIQIKHSGEVVVRAPYHMPDTIITGFIAQKTPWITHQLAQIKQRETKPSLTTLPNSVSYQGKNYPLHLRQQPQYHQPHWQIEQAQLYLYYADTVTPDQVNGWLSTWLAKKALILFPQQLEQCSLYFVSQLTHLLHQQPTLKLSAASKAFMTNPRLPLRLRWMSSRWGSLSSLPKMTLNIALIQMDPSILNAVIMHELCHLLERNHSPRFYAWLTQMSPNWRAAQQVLKTSHPTLHIN